MPGLHVHARGTGAQRGAELGTQLRDPLHAIWEKWAAHYDALGFPSLPLADRLVESPAWETAERFAPDLVRELESLAHSSGLTWTQVSALSMLDEGWAMTGGMACTAVAITRSDARAAGQNMDLNEWTNGFQTILNLVDKDGLGVIAATYPGSLATCGANSNGVVVVVNALDLQNDPAGLPVDFVTRGALHQPTAKDAIAFIREVPHGVGQNYTVLDRHDLFMVEADATGVIDVPLDSAVSIHTNHSFTRDYQADESSQTRYDAAVAARPTLNSAQDIMDLLQDTESGICTAQGRWGRDLYSFMGIVGDSLTGNVWINSAPSTGGTFERIPFDL